MSNTRYLGPTYLSFSQATGKEVRFPVVSFQNVFILPGIPDLLQRIFANFGDGLFSKFALPKFHVRECFVKEHETEIAERLNKLVADYPEVSFGSYPQWFHNYFKTRITIEAANSELADQVKDCVVQVMPTVMDYDPNPREDMLKKIENFYGSITDATFKEITLLKRIKTTNCFNFCLCNAQYLTILPLTDYSQHN